MPLSTRSLVRPPKKTVDEGAEPISAPAPKSSTRGATPPAPKKPATTSTPPTPYPTEEHSQHRTTVGAGKGTLPQTAAQRAAQEKEKTKPVLHDPLDPIGAVQMAALRLKYRQELGTGALREDIEAALPEPTALQLRIEQSPAKRKVINTGRRVGKTTGGARVAIKKALDGRRVLLASTTQDQADAFWEKCKLWLEPWIVSGDIIKNETKRTLQFVAFGEGRIKVKTASSADTLRGDFADFLILDECALLAPNAWNEVGAPMLLDNDGDCWFLSTPRRRNWFYGLYQRAVADTTGRWAYFHATSFDNPHLSEAALEEIVEDLTEEAYRQEILAEFLEGEGQVFRKIAACLTADPYATYEDHRGHDIVGGLDWGQKSDYTCLCVFCATCMEELAIEHWNRMDWDLLRDRVVNATRLWHVGRVLGEMNSIGSPNMLELQKEGVQVEGFDTQATRKRELIRSLQLALEKQKIKLQKIEWATGELEAYEAKVSKITGNVSYSAPEGMHDDSVIARGLALKTAIDGPGTQAPSTLGYRELAAVVERTEEVFDSSGFGEDGSIDGYYSVDMFDGLAGEVSGQPGILAYNGIGSINSLDRYTGLE